MLRRQHCILIQFVDLRYFFETLVGSLLLRRACDFAFVADAASTEWESKYNALKESAQTNVDLSKELELKYKKTAARNEVTDVICFFVCGVSSSASSSSSLCLLSDINNMIGCAGRTRRAKRAV